MLRTEDNELMCRVGPGTPMGDVMREYWIPALMSSELAAPDGPPLRLRLLSEELIAFRSTSGKVGVVANSCPHRGASLFFGRNEEEGLRCVYHGWKFDVSGACVDMPSEPAESNFKSKVHARAYPCIERNGIIWTYMGSRETLPPLPDLEPNAVPDEPFIMKIMRDCNWVQGLEGDIDTSHLSFLHFGSVQAEQMKQGRLDYYSIKIRAPTGYDVHETEFGTSYGAFRPAEEDTYYWRVAHFLFPFYSMIPTGTLGAQVLVRAWVPIDDEHIMFWHISTMKSWRELTGQSADSDGGAALAGPSAMGINFLPDTSDGLGRFRINQTMQNDYLIDREAQSSNKSYTGIPGIHQQDQAVTESMGRIINRAGEHLGSSDSMVIRTRRRLINVAKALRDQGIAPPGVDNPEVYQQRSGGVILPRKADWLDATTELRKAYVEHRPEALVAPVIPDFD